MKGEKARVTTGFHMSAVIASLGDVGVLAVLPSTATIDWAQHVQLDVRVAAVVIHPDVWTMLDANATRLLVHNVVANLAPRGSFATGEHAFVAGHAVACGLEREGIVDGVAWWRRADRATIHDLVADAREELRRISVDDLVALQARDSQLVLLDTRTPTDRERDGVIAGSIHAPRTVLEWLVDPASGYQHEAITGFDQTLVVLCSEGYSSSLAAASLHRLGFFNATDLIGGVRAWGSAGRALVRPDHEHQET